MILLDTNLLGRLTDSTDRSCAAARKAIHVLLARRERLIIVPQNVYEFWAVATRKFGPPPAGQNGLGMSCPQATQWLNFFLRRFMLLPDRAELLPTWQALVQTHAVNGLKCYDARLVAAMQNYGIQRLLTFNAGDFKEYAITILDPSSF